MRNKLVLLEKDLSVSKPIVKKCRFENCNKPCYSYRLCVNHYHQIINRLPRYMLTTKIRNAIYYQYNREKISEYNKKNRQRINMLQRKRRELLMLCSPEYREKCCIASKKHYYKYRLKIRKTQNKIYEKNPKVRELNRKRCKKYRREHKKEISLKEKIYRLEKKLGLR